MTALVATPTSKPTPKVWLLCREFGCEKRFTGIDRHDQLARHEAEDHAEPVDLTSGPEHPCAQCRKTRKTGPSYATAAGLEWHQLIAHGPIRCLAVGCTWRFELGEARKVHLIHHHRTDEIACSCGELLTGAIAFERHQRDAHPELVRRRQKAPQVPVRHFPAPKAAPSAGKEHRVSTSPGNPIECSVCREVFPGPRQFAGHKGGATKYGTPCAAATAIPVAAASPTPPPSPEEVSAVAEPDVQTLPAPNDSDPGPSREAAESEPAGEIQTGLLGTDAITIRLTIARGELEVLEAAAFLGRCTVADLVEDAVGAAIDVHRADPVITAVLDRRQDGAA